MKRLLQIEWAKLSAYRPFWWLTIFYLALTPAVLLFIDTLNIPIFDIGASHFLYSFPMGWNVAAWFSSWFHLLLGIIIVIFSTNEFNHRTAGQHIIDGLTRNEFFLSKLTLTAIMSVVATLYTMLIAIIGSLIYTNGLSNFTDGIEMMPIFLFQTFGYLCIALLFSLLLRSSGYAILLFLAAIFVEWILRGILGEHVSGWIAVFSPIGMISNLTPMPFLQNYLSAEDTKYILSTGERFLYGSLYIGTYIVISYRLITKRDM